MSATLAIPMMMEPICRSLLPWMTYLSEFIHPPAINILTEIIKLFLTKDIKPINIMQFIYTGEDTWLLYEAQRVSCCKSVDYTRRHTHNDFLIIISAKKGTTRDAFISPDPAITVREHHWLKQHDTKSIQKYLGNKTHQTFAINCFKMLFVLYLCVI